MCDCHVPQDRYGCKEIKKKEAASSWPGTCPGCFYLHHLLLILKTGLSRGNDLYLAGEETEAQERSVTCLLLCPCAGRWALTLGLPASPCCVVSALLFPLLGYMG